MKKFIIFIGLLFTLGIFSSDISHAANDFEHKATVNYFVEPYGNAVVDYSFETTNKINTNYLKQFTLQFPFEPKDLDASNSSTQIRLSNPTKVNEANFYSVDITFAQPNYGINKKFYWSIKFRIKEFLIEHAMQKVIAIPTFYDLNNKNNSITDYSIKLNVNKKLDKPKYIYTNNNYIESQEYYIYEFKKADIVTSSITAILGDKQDYKFEILPSTESEYSLPISTSFQTISYISIPARQYSQQVDTIQDNRLLLKTDDKVEGYIITNDSEDNYYIDDVNYISEVSDFIKQLSGGIVIDQDLPDKEKSRQLYNYLQKYFTVNNYLPSIDNQVIYNSSKDSTDKYILNTNELISAYRELLSSKGIKSRGVYGYVFPVQPFKRTTYLTEKHIWVEVWDGSEWITTDPLWLLSSRGTEYFGQGRYHHLKFGEFTDFSELSDFLLATNSLRITPLLERPELDLNPTIEISYDKETYLNKEIRVRFKNSGSVPIYVNKFELVNNSSFTINSKSIEEEILLLPGSTFSTAMQINYDLNLFERNLDFEIQFKYRNNINQKDSESKNFELSIILRPNVSTYFSLIILGVFCGFIILTFFLISLYKPKFQ